MRPSDRTILQGFLLVALLAWGWVAVRAWAMPMVHDEARAYFLYVYPGVVDPHQVELDAANHLLITAAGLLMHAIFGAAPWVLRAFPVACFGLYAYYAWRMAAPVRDPLVRCCLLAALLLTPFTFDLFCLFRGYGPGLAFLLMALVHGLEYLRGHRSIDLWWHTIAMVLSVAACLSFLTTWALALVALLLYVPFTTTGRARWSALAPLLLLAVPVFCLLASYGMELSAAGKLYYGSDRGAYRGTWASLCDTVFGDAGAFSMAGTAAALFGALGVAVHRARHLGRMALQDPLLVLCTLLVGEVFGRVFLHAALGTLFPLDRAALHWVLLGLPIIALAIDRLAVARPPVRYTALLLLFLPVRTLANSSTDHLLFWRTQAIPHAHVRTLVARQAEAPWPLVVRADRFTEVCLAHAVLVQGGDLPYADTHIDPAHCDLLLSYTDSAPPGFRAVPPFTEGHVNLFERTEALAYQVAVDSLFVGQGHTYLDLLHWAAAAPGGAPWIVEASVKPGHGHLPAKARIVLEVKDQEGRRLHYATQGPLQHDSDRYYELTALHVVPSDLPNAATVHLYLWDPEGAELDVRCHVRARMQVDGLGPASAPTLSGTSHLRSPAHNP